MKWIVMTRYALWFGDVQQLSAQLRSPLDFWGRVWVLESASFQLVTYLKQVSNALLTLRKDSLNITCYSTWQWGPVAWLPCLHERLPSTIMDNFEWAGTFTDPADDLSSVKNSRQQRNEVTTPDWPSLTLCELLMWEGKFTLPFCATLFKASAYWPIQ
jgi:hypothetical protein